MRPSCFSELLNSTILVYQTKIEKLNQFTHNQNRQWSKVDSTEIKACLGLLLIGGCCRGRREPRRELWYTENLSIQRPVFAAAMTRTRFEEIIQEVFHLSLVTVKKATKLEWNAVMSDEDNSNKKAK